ncbi:MAG: PIN domain-containing protein [Promethearchaeota archaeon]
MHAIIDTNILIYDTIEDSIHHQESQELLNNLSSWQIPIIVMYEYIWFFRELKFTAIQVNELIKGRISNPKCKIISDDMTYTQDALTQSISQKFSLSRFNDMVILSVAKRKDLPLLTFDNKLRKNANALNINVIPKEIRKSPKND